MHARVVTGQYVPGKEDEIAQVAQEALEKQMKPQEGFKNRIFLMDPTTNKFLAISLWEEEAHAQKNFPTTYQQAKESAQQHLTADPVAETYQVRYFD
jgi:heme-degrading monooxygenase HmoA